METSRKRRRFETFHREEKIALINAVKNQSCIWNTKSKQYCDIYATRSAWESVGAALNKDANECRSAWQSLKDSLRYHRNKMVKYGSAGNSVDWEFAKYMDFLSNMSSHRRTACNKLDESESPEIQSSDGDTRGFMGYFEQFVFKESQKPFLEEVKEVERDKNRESSGQSKRNFKRKRIEDKIELINAVKNQNCLWDIKSRKYWDLKETRRAWESVGAKLNRDAYDCRSAWRSLKDSLRYHKKKPKEYANWALAPFMNFLPLPLERSVVEEDSEEYSTHPAMSPTYSIESLFEESSENEDTIDGLSPELQSNKPKFEKDEYTDDQEINLLPEDSCPNDDNKSEISLSSANNDPSKKADVKENEHRDEQEEITFIPDESCANEDNNSKISSLSVNNYPSKKPKVNEVEQKVEREKIIVDRYLNVLKPERNIFPFWNELLSKLPPSNATAVEMEITNLIYAKVKAYELNHNYD